MGIIKLEIIDSEKEIFLRDIPSRFRKVILDEIKKNLRLFRNNKGLDVKVINIGVKYFTNSKVNENCLPKDAVVVCVNVKFDRLDRTKEFGYKHRSTGHIGITIFLPKVIMRNRSNLINSILEE